LRACPGRRRAIGCAMSNFGRLAGLIETARRAVEAAKRKRAPRGMSC